MIDIKKIRHITSALSLIAMVLLAIVVVRFSQTRDNGFKSIRWELPKDQATRKPSTVIKQTERKLVIPEPRKKPSSPFSVSKKAAKVSLPKDEEPVEESDLLRENIPDMLAWAIAKDFPDVNLSESEIQELAETMMTFRRSMKGLREIKQTSENTESIIQMRDQMGQATIDFKRITGMSLMEFMLQAPAAGGIDNNESDNEEIDFEYINDSRQ